MINNDLNIEPLEWLKKIPPLITGIISLVTVIVGFVKLWQGNTGLVTTILIALGVGGLALCLIYCIGISKFAPKKK